jgi:hypothetical protein
MRPFQIRDSFTDLVEHYPSADRLRQALVRMNPMDRSWFLRLWLTEGIPFVFRGKPAVYEAIRDWLATQLHVGPKEITLIGSGRIGYSLAPDGYGQPFSPESDLDFTVISSDLFVRLCDAFKTWKGDVESGRIRPCNPKEDLYWSDNLGRLPSNINRGFLDARKIPYKYHELGKLMWELEERLAKTVESLKIRDASVRVYRTWENFEAQATMNLERTTRTLIRG